MATNNKNNNFSLTDSGIESKPTTPNKTIRIKDEKDIAKQVENYKNELEQQRIKNQVQYEIELRAKGYTQLTKVQQDSAEEMYNYLNRYQLENVKNVEKVREQLVQDFEKKSALDKAKSTTKVNKQREDDLRSMKNDALQVKNDKNASKEDREEAKKVLKELNKELGEDFGSQFKKNNLSLEAVVAKVDKAISKLASSIENGINNVITKYANYQSAIDVRLQGLDTTFSKIDSDLTKNVGVTSWFKTETLMDNVQSLAESGIVYNIEQRAFLETISDKIAATFDTTNATLLRLVKLQQEDSTASRLGMEAYLTRYFNQMWQDTQYLQTNYDTVSAALLEATSTMTNDEAIQFEYQVQKWLGSLSSIGMSDSTISSLATAIGALGSGDISSLQSNEGMQNLIVMAASNAGLDYASMLSEGLDASSTNVLMQSIVNYLKDIATSSSNNKVVMSQYAETFGVDISDLKAATNLQTEQLQSLATNFMDANGAMEELAYQMTQISSRMSLSEKLENVFNNALYSLGSNIAESPGAYATWKVTSLIQDYTGGINIPSISVLGTGTDLNTTVENLVKLGVVGYSTLGMIGDIVSGIQNSSDPSQALTKLGITSNGEKIKYGSGLESRSVVQTLSSKYIVGNSSGGDIAESAQTSAEQSAIEKIEAQKDTSDDKSINDIYESISELNTLNDSQLSTLNATSVVIDDLYEVQSTQLALENSQLSTLNATTLSILNKMNSMYANSVTNSQYSTNANNSTYLSSNMSTSTYSTTLEDAQQTSYSQSGQDRAVAIPTEETSNISNIATNVNTIVTILQSVLSGDALKVEVSSSNGFGAINI